LEEGGETHTQLVYHIAGRLRPTGTAWDRAILVPIQAVWHIHGMEAEEHAEDGEHEHEAASGTDSAEHGHAHEKAGADHDGHGHHGKVDPDAALDETWTVGAPGLPAILVKPKTIADAYKLRQDYRSGNTVA
ncbi:ABC transporter permease, partial [Rhizobium leguminosarum]|nr:ABC transporter permease [Rhizobium leguminosarum]